MTIYTTGLTRQIRLLFSTVNFNVVGRHQLIMDSPAAIRWYFQSNLKQRTRQGERKQQDTTRKLQKGSISSLIFCNKSGKGRGNNVDTKGEKGGNQEGGNCTFSSIS